MSARPEQSADHIVSTTVTEFGLAEVNRWMTELGLTEEQFVRACIAVSLAHPHILTATILLLREEGDV